MKNWHRLLATIQSASPSFTSATSRASIATTTCALTISQDAQDLTTQTFLAALEGLGSFQGKGSVIAWLYGIARHKAALHFRGKVRQVPLGADHDLTDPMISVEETAEQQLELARVNQALDELTPERAEAILLCLFSGLSNQQAAEVMGKSTAAVKMLVFRGVKELRQRLAPILKEA